MLVPIAGRPLLDYCSTPRHRRPPRHPHQHPPSSRKARSYIDRINNLGRFKVHEAFETKLRPGRHRPSPSQLDSDTDTALIIYADNLSNVDMLLPLLPSLPRRRHDHSLPAPYPQRCGIAQPDMNSRIVELREAQAAQGQLANGVFYALTASAYHDGRHEQV
jgi:hypothetical protein